MTYQADQPTTEITIEQIDDALAKVALLMQWPGGYGLAYLPIFERLEREREQMSGLDGRLARAVARAKERPSRSLKATNSDLRNSRILAA